MSEPKQPRQFRATAPFFVVKDLLKSVAYFHEVLGFNNPPLWGDPPDFAMPSRDGFIIMLSQAKPGVELITNRDMQAVWDAYVWINDADTLFAELKEAGAVVEYEPRIQTDYDMKEFAVRDLDGHVIAFGQDFKP